MQQKLWKKRFKVNNSSQRIDAATQIKLQAGGHEHIVLIGQGAGGTGN